MKVSFDFDYWTSTLKIFFVKFNLTLGYNDKIELEIRKTLIPIDVHFACKSVTVGIINLYIPTKSKLNAKMIQV